jgi:hypothetical protein
MNDIYRINDAGGLKDARLPSWSVNHSINRLGPLFPAVGLGLLLLLLFAFAPLTLVLVLVLVLVMALGDEVGVVAAS